jgi:hypothetical protein
MAAKINNVRVHVWTKAEVKQTVKQLKENGFTVKLNVNYPGNTQGIDPMNGEVIFEGGGLRMGPGYPVRVNETYFDYN